MAGQWDDFLIRTNLQDTGQVPRSGGWISPDIIPAGQAPISNPTAVYGSQASYATDPGKDILYNATNFIYLRSKNLFNGQNTGTAYLFYSDSQLLNYTSNWRPVGDVNGLAISSSDLAQIVTPGKAFVWENTPPQPSGFHYCLISWIKTQAHPTFPNLDNVNTLAAFITQNDNWSQRNITIIQQGAPDFDKKVNYNQGPIEAAMNFSVTWTTPPVGSQVRLVARDPIGSTVLDSGKVTITQQNFGFVFPPVQVPADYKTVFDLEYWSNGGSGGNEMSFTLNAYYFVPPAQRSLIGFGKNMAGHGIAHLPVIKLNDSSRLLNDFEPTPAILLGSQVVSTVR
jgi:hypothetical protein